MAPQPSPWQADILATFTDESTQDAVDGFMRARVQPRMTQLEQERKAAEAQYAETQAARELMDSFQNDPVGTFRSVRQQLTDLGYSLEEATQMANAAQAEANAAPTAAPAAPANDPRLDEMYADWQQTKQLEAYDESIARIVNDPRNGDINPNRLHVFVAAAEGNFDRALEMYRADVAEVLTTYGLDPNTATAQQVEQAGQLAAAAAANAAPAVMGASAGGAGAPVPTTPDYRNQGLSPVDALHKSIEDAAAAMLRGNAPPTV